MSCIVLLVFLFGFVGCSKEEEAILVPEDMVISKENVIYEEGRLVVDSQIVLTASEAKYKTIERIVKSENGEIIGYIPFSGDYQINFPEGKTYEELKEIIDKWSGKELVETASLNHVFQVSDESVNYENDPWIDTSIDDTDGQDAEWSEVNPKGTNWWAEAIYMPTVWNMDIWNNLSGENIKIGVMDTVFDVEHEDLDDVFVETWENVDPLDNDLELSKSSQSHGTHVSGLIAAEIGNNSGIAGVAACVEPQLYGFAMHGQESQTYASMMQWKYAIALMLEQGVKAINISMGYDCMQFAVQQENEAALKDLEDASSEMSVFLKKAISTGYDFLIVKSAGNTSGYKWVECQVDKKNPYGYRKAKGLENGIQQECSSKFDFLGAITDTEVRDRIIIVGAAKQDVLSELIGRTGYKRAPFSNTDCDIYAPGVDVLSTVPSENKTTCMEGTSQATPIVTGVAGLVWSINPGLSGPQVKEILMTSSNYSAIAIDPIGDLNASDDEVTIINAAFAVNLASGVDGEGASTENTTALMGLVYQIVGEDREEVRAYVPNAKVTFYSHNEEKEYEILELGEESMFSTFLPEGTYSIAVEANGYRGHTTSVELGQDATYLSIRLYANGYSLQLSFEYEMKEENIEFTTSEGISFYKNTIKYPYFLGDSDVAVKLNQRYQNIISDCRENDEDFDKSYQEYMEWDSLSILPYYDDLVVEVTYNQNGYISLYEINSMWSGGAHPYNYESGITYQLESGNECSYTDILVGTENGRTNLIKYYLKKEVGDSYNYNLNDFFEETPYTLVEEGICFYFWIGDAVAPVEIIIPYTEENSCVILVEEALKKIGYTDSQDNASLSNNRVDLSEYLSNTGFIIKAKEMADKLGRMTLFNDDGTIYSDLNGTFIEANNNNEIFRVEWDNENISLYNLKIDDAYQKVEEILSENEYQLNENDSRTSTKNFIKENISIWVFLNKSTMKVVGFEIDLSE